MPTTAVLIIGIAGGSASGKSTFARSLAKVAGRGQATILELDRFYHPLGPTADETQCNFDEPNAIDFGLVDSVVNHLVEQGQATTPIYDFATHTRTGYELLHAAPFIIVEGLLTLWHQPLRDALACKIFVQTPDQLRLERRRDRDVRERGRQANSVEKQWRDTVLPMHHNYVEPTKQHADQIVDGEGDLDHAARFIFGQLTQ